MSILRKLFGPSRSEIWQKLADEIGAKYTTKLWKGERVQASHGEWTITLDTYVISTGKSSTTYTRLRAPFVNPDGFRFTVYRRNWYSDLAKKFFGMQDVEVGQHEFDRDFIIKGTDPEKLRRLFANPKIRELIQAQPDITFSIFDSEGFWGPKFPENTDELSFAVYGVITDIARLKQLFELFAETLDELCRIGSAYQTKPDLDL